MTTTTAANSPSNAYGFSLGNKYLDKIGAMPQILKYKIIIGKIPCIVRYRDKD